MPSTDDKTPLFEAGEAAVAHIVRRRLLRSDAALSLAPRLRSRAFWSAGIDDVNALRRMREAIDTIPAGGDFKKVRNQIAGEYAEIHTPEEAKRRAALVIRTNVNQAVAAVRYTELRENEDIFPYWKYQTTGDQAVRDQHAKLDGMVAPASDPIWERVYPPSAFNCRCVVTGITAAEAEAMGPFERGAEGVPNKMGLATSDQTKSLLDRWLTEDDGQYHFDSSSLEYDFEEISEDWTEEEKGFFKELVTDDGVGKLEWKKDADGNTTVDSPRGVMEFEIRDKWRKEVMAAGGMERLIIVDLDTLNEVARAEGTADRVETPDISHLFMSRLFAIHNHPNIPKPSLSAGDFTESVRTGIMQFDAEGTMGWEWAEINKLSDADVDRIREFAFTEQKLKNELREYRLTGTEPPPEFRRAAEELRFKWKLMKRYLQKSGKINLASGDYQ